MRKDPYCVAFSLMQTLCYNGTWGNGSFRFLHCVCKMIDEGTPKLGTTMMTSTRALRGWGTCDEDLFPSNLELSVSEFEDWKSIPKEAWEDAKQKRIEMNRAILVSWPIEIIYLNGRVLRLVTSYSPHLFEREDSQYGITVINDEFETVAWAQLRSYEENKQIILEDLFVKPEFRRTHIGTQLLHRIEQISCLDLSFCELSDEILIPIPFPDAGPNRYNAVKEFFQKNGYTWMDRNPIRSSESYSIFTAVKMLPCKEIREDPEAHAAYAFLLANLKRYETSEKHYKQAIEIKKKEEKWIDVAYLCGELGGLYEEKKKLKQAENCYANVLEISRRIEHKPLQNRAACDLARISKKRRNFSGRIINRIMRPFKKSKSVV